MTAIRVRGQNIAVMFDLQLPLTVKPHTTFSNPCNKVRGKYIVKEVFLCRLLLRLINLLRQYVSLNPTLKTGRKWKVKDTIISAKENLAFKEVIGLIQTGRQGLGVNENKWWSKANGKDRRDMVIQEVRNEEDNKRLIKGVQQSQQGQWRS